MNNLKKLREERGITQLKLATDLNLVKSTICQYEKGNRDLGVTMLIKLSDYFNVSIDYLVGRTEQEVNAVEEYTEQEKRLIKAYRALIPSMQENILELVEGMTSTAKKKGNYA